MPTELAKLTDGLALSAHARLVQLGRGGVEGTLRQDLSSRDWQRVISLLKFGDRWLAERPGASSGGGGAAHTVAEGGAIAASFAGRWSPHRRCLEPCWGASHGPSIVPRRSGSDCASRRVGRRASISYSGGSRTPLHLEVRGCPSLCPRIASAHPIVSDAHDGRREHRRDPGCLEPVERRADFDGGASAPQAPARRHSRSGCRVCGTRTAASHVGGDRRRRCAGARARGRDPGRALAAGGDRALALTTCRCSPSRDRLRAAFSRSPADPSRRSERDHPRRSLRPIAAEADQERSRATSAQVEALRDATARRTIRPAQGPAAVAPRRFRSGCRRQTRSVGCAGQSRQCRRRCDAVDFSPCRGPNQCCVLGIVVRGAPTRAGQRP
jgi:hypothetical protein